jgi:hypothetical protein
VSSTERPEERRRTANGICADVIDQQCDLQPEIAAALRTNFPQYRRSRNRISLASQAEKWGEALIAGWYFLVRLNKEPRGEHPALIGEENGTPPAWLSRGPREHYSRPPQPFYPDKYEPSARFRPIATSPFRCKVASQSLR